MGWIITKDHVESSEVGRGQQSLSDDKTQFKLYDADNELMYEGEISWHWIRGYPEKAFAPLDWAQWNAGATDMYFLNENGQWKQL